MELRKLIRTNCKKNCCFLPEAVLRITGTSFNENDSLWYKVFSQLCFFVLVIYPINNIILVIQHIDDFDMVGKTVFHVVGGIAGLFKAWTLRANKNLLRQVIGEIIILQDKLNVKKGSQQTIYNSNRMILVFLMSMLVLCTIVISTAMAMRLLISDPNKWILPFSEIAFINRTYSPNFEIAWGLQGCAVVHACFNFVISSIFIAALMVDMVVQLELFQKRIQVMISKARAQNDFLNQQDGQGSSWFYLEKVLKEIVIEHNRLIDLVNKIEEVANWIVVVDVLSNLVMIAFCVYYMSLMPISDARSLQILTQLVGVIGCLFYSCYWGTQLSVQGQAIGTACYTSNFLGSDKRFQKGLCMVMMRSDKPLYITVGKFAILSINVFAMIMRTSYSVYMVLNKSIDTK